MRSLCLLAAVLALLALPLQAHAHGIWFAQRADRLALIYGDGGEDLDAVKRLPKVTSVVGADAAGRPVAVTIEPEGRLPFVNLAEKPVVVAATMDNGLWSKTADGKWHGKGLADLPDAVVSGRYLKYAAHLIGAPAGAVPPLAGLTLQALPVGATFPRAKDERLTLQVLFEGRPLAGAKVWQDMVGFPDAEPVRTGRDGRITLRVRNQGLNVVKVEHESAPADAAQSRMTHHLATLSFVIPQAAE